MKMVDKEQILLLHQTLINYTGGSARLRDEGLLESALSAPFGGVSMYNTIQSKAARLCFGLIMNHPFINGNKRIGILAMMLFLEINGICLECKDEELIKLGLEIASGVIGEKEF